jgi:preprotein translocase subunit YajC
MSGGGFLIIIVAFVFLWFVLIRPQKRRQLEARQLANSLEVGTDVVTAGGIYGEITGIDGDDVTVRIAPQVEVRLAKRAIGAVIPKDVEPAAEPEPPAPDAGG